MIRGWLQLPGVAMRYAFYPDHRGTPIDHRVPDGHETSNETELENVFRRTHVLLEDGLHRAWVIPESHVGPNGAGMLVRGVRE